MPRLVDPPRVAPNHLFAFDRPTHHAAAEPSGTLPARGPTHTQLLPMKPNINNLVKQTDELGKQKFTA